VSAVEVARIKTDGTIWHCATVPHVGRIWVTFRGCGGDRVRLRVAEILSIQVFK
jgi:hypothetical protein